MTYTDDKKNPHLEGFKTRSKQMSNNDETTRWSGAIELIVVLVFVCVN